MHWPNLLHPDPGRNSEIVAGWVKYLAAYDAGFETLLAPDSTFFQQQLAHHVCTGMTINGQFIDLDFSRIKPVPDQTTGLQFILKISSASRLQFKTENIKLLADSFIMEKERFLYTITLERIPERPSARMECIKAA